MNQHHLLIALTGVPLLLLILTLGTQQRREAQRKLRAPVSEKSLRSPGESLRNKLELLDGKINDLFLWIAILPLIVLGSLTLQRDVTLLVAWGMGGIVALVSGCLIARARRLVQERNDYRLGFSGERAVGEELNKLMLDGCFVFHDFPADGNWNIDHIVVAPSGVYAVETKTRRKSPAPPGQKDHEVVCEKGRLQFPRAFDAKAVPQALRQASWLSQYLGKAIAEKVFVEPLVTLPGWFVIAREPDGVKVLNPKQIRRVIQDNSPALSPQRMQQIAHQLDQKCRDVEF